VKFSVLFLLYICLFILTCVSSPAFASPSIQFDEIVFQMGEVESGKDVKAVFSFKNVGDEDLEIKGITASCDCTLTKASITRIGPGQSSTIEIDFKTSSLGGVINKIIAVNTNDPAQPAAQLLITGKVIPVATLSPERINFGTITVGSTAEYSVTVTPLKQDGFAISKIDITGTHVTAPEFIKINDDKGSYSVKVRITAGDTPGRVLETLTIVTSLPNNPTINLMVFGNVAANEDKH